MIKNRQTPTGYNISIIYLYLSTGYNISNRHSHQYINYHTKNNLLYCYSLCLRNNAMYIFSTESNCSLTSLHSTFKQRISICMCLCTHGRQMIVTETSKTTNFQACVFVTYISLYWLTIPFISISTFFYWWIKVTNKTTTLLACFFYNTILY